MRARKHTHTHTHLSMYLSIAVFCYLSFSLPKFVHMYLSIYFSLLLSFPFSILVCTYLSIYLSIYHYLSLYRSIHLSHWFSCSREWLCGRDRPKIHSKTGRDRMYIYTAIFLLKNDVSCIVWILNLIYFNCFVSFLFVFQCLAFLEHRGCIVESWL